MKIPKEVSQFIDYIEVEGFHYALTNTNLEDIKKADKVLYDLCTTFFEMDGAIRFHLSKKYNIELD